MHQECASFVLSSHCIAGNFRWRSLAPALLTIDNFLSSAECDQLVEIASSGVLQAMQSMRLLSLSDAFVATDLRRSRVTDGHVSSGRTSTSCFLTGDKARWGGSAPWRRSLSRSDLCDKALHPLVVLLERRMLLLVSAIQQSLNDIEGGTDEDTSNFVGAEPLQVVRYSVGQGYTSHFDNRSGSVARVATLMVYLRAPEDGGCTFFPRARSLDGGPSSPGISIEPKKGRAVYFRCGLSQPPPLSTEQTRHRCRNVRNGTPVEDDHSLHEAQPVLAGSKSVCTLWVGRRG